jgi:hypothetical protein
MVKRPESKKTDIEFAPDAWARFERAAGVVAKSPPQHRAGKAKKSISKKPKKQKPA